MKFCPKTFFDKNVKKGRQVVSKSLKKFNKKSFKKFTNLQNKSSQPSTNVLMYKCTSVLIPNRKCAKITIQYLGVPMLAFVRERNICSLSALHRGGKPELKFRTTDEADTAHVISGLPTARKRATLPILNQCRVHMPQTFLLLPIFRPALVARQK